MPVFQENRALLDAFRRGDQDALAFVYHAYVDRVAALVRHGFDLGPEQRHVPGARDPEAERDLVQEVFTRAFAEAARLAYDGLRTYRPYLMRIAKNLLIDRARQRLREPLVLDDLEPEPAAESAQLGSAEEELHWRTLSAAVPAYLASLSAEAREFVRWRFEEDLSQAEVAEKMGLSRRRIRTLEQRVQTGLSRHLRKITTRFSQTP